MRIDRSFPAVFDFEVLTELPSGDEERFFFPSGRTRGGHDGPNVRFEPPAGTSWIGTFGRGDFGPRASTGIFTTPNPEQLCVATFGRAYVVSAHRGGGCYEVDVHPVLDIRVSLKHRLLTFANFSQIAAFGAEGEAWRTDRICWDELKITGMDDDFIYGTGWDSPTGTVKRFAVDLVSGRHGGGSAWAP